VRTESVGKAALSWTVILATLNVLAELGTVSVEASVPGLVADVAAGIVLPTLFDGQDCGPVSEPAGPMVWSTSLGGNALTCVRQSKVRSNVLVVPLTIRLSLPDAPGTAVLTTCGPGTISGSVS